MSKRMLCLASWPRSIANHDRSRSAMLSCILTSYLMELKIQVVLSADRKVNAADSESTSKESCRALHLLEVIPVRVTSR